jgi:hypothetical protein
MSKGNAAYHAAFSVVWLAGCLWVALQAPVDGLARAVAVLLGLGIGAIPALVVASIPYSVVLSEDGECAFRSLLRERRIRVEQITSIEWEEDEIVIRDSEGRVRILADRSFKDLLIRLLALNPTIRTEDAVRRTLAADD